MKLFTALLAVFIVAGCSNARVLNDGAIGPWRVTLSSIAQTNADFQGQKAPVGLATVGWCDHARQEIRLSYDRGQRKLIADSWHELGHKLEREYPRIWEILDAMDTPDFPCGSDELHEFRRSEAKAIEAARAAASAAKGSD
jgi:hypothetical protein